jgi:hypothetical protein
MSRWLFLPILLDKRQAGLTILASFDQQEKRYKLH